MKINLTFLFVLLSMVAVFAQFPDFGGVGQPSGGGGSTQAEYVYDPDTFGVFYFYADNPNEETPFKDSLLDNFEEYEVIRQRNLEYADLGNVGSATRQLFYQPTFRRGFDIGFHQYDIYLINAKNTPYYRIKKNAFTRASYSQHSQEDNIFTGQYSRNFSGGLNFSVDYRRMKHQGQYKSQKTSNSAFATSWWYHAKGGRYDAYLSFSSNTNTEQDNGGIDLTDAAASLLTQPFTIPVYRDGETANTTHISQEYSYTHYFKIIGGPPRPPKQPKRDTTLNTFPFLPKDSLQLLGMDSLTLDSLMSLGMDSLTLDSLMNLEIDSLEIDSLMSLKMDSLVVDSFVVDSLVLDSLVILDSLSIPRDSLMLPDSMLRQDTSFQRPDLKKVKRRGDNPKGRSRPRPPFNQAASSGSLLTEIQGPPKRAVTLAHQIAYKRSIYKFSDTSVDSDGATDFYGGFAVHRRGLRNFINHKRLENSFRLSTFKARSNKLDDIRLQQDLLEVGLTHSIHFIDQEVQTSTVNNLFLTGKWHFSPSDRVQVKTDAHLAFWDNAGDYRINGELFFDLKQAGKLRVTALHQRYAPSLVQQRTFISALSVWENDFAKIFETSVTAAYTIPFIKVEVSGQYHLLNNFIYFDTLAMPQQTSTAISIGQLIFKKNLKIWRFHLDNTFILQQNSSDVLRLPKFFTSNSLYFEGRLFKRILFTRVGVDFRLNGAFNADRFHALTGQFYLQDEKTAVVYPSLDVFISFKVERFRFFAKLENALDKTIGELNYLSAYYPQRFLGFRFGISWRFRN